MKGRRAMGRITVLLMIMLFAGVGEVAAQLCADTPVRAGRPALSASIGFGESTTSYGLGFQTTPANHLRLAASYGAGDMEGRDFMHSIGASGGYERPLGTGLVCPWAALGLSQSLNGGDWGRSLATTASVGVTIGAAAYEDGRYRITPFVRPYYSVGSPISEMTDGGWSDSYGVGGGALAFLNDRIFGVGTVSVAEGGRTGVSFQFGWLLR